MTLLDDARLERVLASIGEDLEVTAAPRPTGVWETPRLRLVAALLILVIAASLVITPVRRTVADWLGIGNTDVEVDPSAAGAAGSLPSVAVGLDPVTDDEAETLVGEPLPLLDATDLGSPSGLARMPEGGVLVVWPDATTLWIRHADGEPGQWMQKVLSTVDQAVRVDDLGDEALAITGDHVLLTPHRRLSAGNVVLWLSGDLELRLEGDRPIPELIALARAIDQPV